MGVVSPVAKCTEDFLSGKRTVTVKLVLIINDDTGQNDLTLPRGEEGESLEQEGEGILRGIGEESQEDKETKDGERALDEEEVLPRLQSAMKTQDAGSHQTTDARDKNVANKKDSVPATEFGSLVESGDGIEGAGDVWGTISPCPQIVSLDPKLTSTFTDTEQDTSSEEGTI